MKPADQLDAGLAELVLSLPSAAPARMIRYLELLQKWNQVYNLTAIRDLPSMVSQHLLDSLSVLPHLPVAGSLADIGSGAGLPGIPLALARPQLEVTLVETVSKKASFLQQAKTELELTNVSIHCGRVEAWATTQVFNALISRAFSDLATFLRLAGHLLGVGGRLFAMKGALTQHELDEVPPGWALLGTPQLHVPGLAAQRHLIILERQ